MDKVNYYFKMRSAEDVGLNLSVICKGLGYAELDKNRVQEIYGVTDECLNGSHYLSNIIKMVKEVDEPERDKVLGMCEKLQQMWEKYREKFLKYIAKCLDIEFGDDVVSSYCYLHKLPINEVGLDNNIIYLDCNNSVEEVFKNFIIMLTKSLLLDRWERMGEWCHNYEFEAQNKVWIFAEMAVDSIFANSELGKLCDSPSYKYFYSIRINGINVMEQFRMLYTMVSLEDFFTALYMFVYQNYQTILKFKNYLY